MGGKAGLVCLDAGLNKICLFFFSPTDRHLGGELWFDNGCSSAWGCGPFPCTQRHPVDAHEQSAWIHRDCPWSKGQEENRYCHSHKCNWAGKRWYGFERSAVVALFPKTIYWLFPLFPIWTKNRIPVDCIICIPADHLGYWLAICLEPKKTVWLYNVPLSYFMSWLWQIGIVPCGRRAAGLCRRGRHGKEASVHGQWGRPGGRPCSPEVHHAQVSVNVILFYLMFLFLAF